MSGICGIVTFDGTSVPVEDVERMMAASSHRGRDGRATWAGDGVVLGHQMLALVPGEERALDPLVAHGRVVVADARLDNRDELLSALRRSGLLDGSDQTDAAVVLAAHRRWGARCAEHLIGDFAFIVWEAASRTLLAARDPMGMRSLAYHVAPGRRLVVATDVAQVLAAPGVPRRVFEPAVAADMATHFGHPTWTFFEDVVNVAPGHHVVCDASGAKSNRSWDVDPSLEVRHERLEGYVEQLRATFCDAVAARLRTTRPVGFLLSGGMDSTSAASATGWLREHGVAPAHEVLACQWAFEQEPQCDERAVSRLITARYGFVDIDIPADDAGALACYPEHMPPLDDPMVGGFQPLIEHSLTALAARGAGFVLGGDRGDLVIGDTGGSYLTMARRRQWASLAADIREHRRAHGESLPSMALVHAVAPLVRIARRRSAVGWINWAVERRRGVRSSVARRPAWIESSFAHRTGLEALLHEPAHAPPGLTPAAAARYRLIFNQLHVRGMAWSERTYARAGLGFADPFSDRRLVSLVLAMPTPVLNRPGDQAKPLLRAAMRGIMPEAARSSAAKVVPTPLFERSLRARADLIAELLTSPQIAARGWVDAAALRQELAAWRDGGALLPAAFWWTLGVELWLREHGA